MSFLSPPMRDGSEAGISVILYPYLQARTDSSGSQLVLRWMLKNSFSGKMKSSSLSSSSLAIRFFL